VICMGMIVRFLLPLPVRRFPRFQIYAKRFTHPYNFHYIGNQRNHVTFQLAEIYP